MRRLPAGGTSRTRTPPRVDLQRRRLLILLPLMLMGAGQSLAAIDRFEPPRRQRGSAIIRVRSTGAVGDGVHDDTLAFQRAVDALPDEGGTVEVQAGTYVIDPVRRVRLRSRMHMEFAPGARLVAKPNAEARTYVLLASRISDVEISGGHIVGDRDAHLGEGGEWGHGIAVRGATRVTIRDMHVSRCWGDGISIGGERPGERGWASIPSEDVVLHRVTCSGNRRQGLTIAHSRDIRVQDCEFADTSGTLPQCGIDIEPDPPGSTLRAHIENCRIHGNRGNGIQIYKRTSDVTVQRCTIENNGGFGVLAIGTTDGLIASNVIRGNALKGVGLRGGTSNYQVRENSLSDNRLRQRNRSKPGSGSINNKDADDHIP